MPLYFPAFAALARAPLPRPICRPEHKPYKGHFSLPAAWSGLLTPIPLAPFQCLSACALALACGMAVAQTTTPDHLHHKAAAASATAHSPAHRWSEANDTVGQFQRGHIDLLRWEQRNNPLTNPADKTATRAITSNRPAHDPSNTPDRRRRQPVRRVHRRLPASQLRQLLARRANPKDTGTTEARHGALATFTKQDTP